MERNEGQIEARIQKLESLALRPSGVSASSFAGPIVADEAAASLLTGLRDGEQVFILSHRSIWTSDPNDTRPIVVGPASPDNNQRIARAGGGSLNRTTYSDPNWRMGITDIYVDPSNVTGIASNENRGIFYAPQSGNARQPILTFQELRRRIGEMQYMTTGDLVTRQITLHILSDLSITNLNDLCELELYAGLQTFPVVQGESRTVYVNGVLDNPGGYTIPQPTNPGGGSPPKIKSGAQVWAPYVGYQVFFPATGAVATILKDLGGGVAQITQPVLTNKNTYSLFPTAINPANGEAFQVVLWCGINVGAWRFRFAGTSNSQSGFLQIKNISIVVLTQSDLWTVENESGSTYTIVEFYECRSDRVILNGNNVVWNGCNIAASYQAPHLEVGGGVFACGIVPLDGRPYTSWTGKNSHAINRGLMDFDTAVMGACVISRGPTQLANFSVWDTPTHPTHNPGGHAFLVGESSEERVPGQVAISQGVVYGNGAAGVGLRIAAGSRCVCESAPNIIGNAGEFALADVQTGWFFATATATYQPAAGPLATTWNNFSAAQPGGFGGDAHNPVKDAHLILLSGT